MLKFHIYLLMKNSFENKHLVVSKVSFVAYFLEWIVNTLLLDVLLTMVDENNPAIWSLKLSECYDVLWQVVT